MDEEITAEELHALLETGEDITIVDIRSAEAFERGHIPGSLNLPFHRLPQQIERLNGTERVVTVCPHGKASLQAARLIRSYEGTQTARVESLREGLVGWPFDLERTDE